MGQPQPASPEPAGASGRSKPRLARLLLWALIWLGIGLLLLAAVVVSWARYTAEHIDDYRPRLEALLSDRLGQTVRIDQLSASWHGPDPVLQAEGVTIAHRDAPEETAVSLQHLLLRLDGPRSLLRARLVFQRMEADDLDLVLVQHDEGHLSVEGLTLPEPGPGLTDETLTNEQWLEPRRWLNELSGRIANPHVQLTHVTVGVRTPDADITFVDIPQLELAYRNREMSASGRAMRQGTLEQLATFVVRGQNLFDGRFTGQIWAELTPGGLLEGLARGLTWRGFEIDELDARARAWLTFSDGQLDRLNGDLQIDEIQLHNELEGLTPLQDASARIGWRRTDEGGSVHIEDLQWTWQDDQVSGLAARADYDRLTLQVQVPQLAIGPLTRLAHASGQLPTRAQYHLRGLAPDGTLSAVNLEIPRKVPGEFQLSARVDGVSVQPYQGAPGGSNVHGRVWLNRYGGQAQVDGEDMTLHFPELFSGPWTFRRASGQVGWLMEGGITRVFARNLDAQYQEATRLEGAFDLRLDRYGEDNLGLKVSVENGRADMLAEFVPEKVVDPELYQWLTTAIFEGEVVRGEFFGHGQIGENMPQFGFSTAMEYEFRDARVAYDPAWPEVSDASGRVRIHNGLTEVELDQARTGGLVLPQSRVVVTPGEEFAVLDIDTRAQITGEQIHQWLEETPLGEMAGDARDGLQVSGDYALDLALQIALAPDQPVGVEASLNTDNGEVYQADTDLRWEAISGELGYSSEQGFSGQPLNARFLGQPVTVELALSPEQSLKITQTGQTDIATLAGRLLPEGQAVAGLEGRLPYTALLEFAPETPTRLSVNANSAGLWSDWPAPLGREAGQEEQVRVAVRWLDNDRLWLSGRWGQRLGAVLEWRSQEFYSGMVSVGNTDAVSPGEPGLVIKADVERFAPAEWQSWLERFIGEGATGTGPGTTTATADLEWLNRVELDVAELQVGQHSLPGVSVTVAPEAGGWLLTTNSDRATGYVRIPPTGDQVMVRLDRLELAGATDQRDGEAEAAPLLTATEQLETFRNMAAGQWPEVDVRIDALWLGENPAGAWSFLLSPSPDQITLEDLQGEIGALAFDGQLRWGVTSGDERTVIQGVLEGGGLQDIAALFGMEAPLTNEYSVIDLDVGWPGRPDQYAMGRLDGSFSLRLDDGVILRNNDTAQLFRLFNLLNTDTLQRRLSFDFSDLYEAGVAFDAMSGNGTLDRGVLSWNPDLQMAGPSGALRLSGSTNLADRTLNMRLVVILPLTQNLPLAAILMGASPPVGGALFVLDKLLGEPLSKLTSATYSVGGTWENPEVNLRNIFDAGNQKSE